MEKYHIYVIPFVLIAAMVFMFGPLALVVIKAFAYLIGFSILPLLTPEKMLLCFAWAFVWPMIIAGMST